MKPPPFHYRRCTSLEEAVTLLAEHGAEAKVLAGGQSLMPMLNFRLLRPSLLVDIGRIAGLEGIVEDAAGLTIGAMTRHRRLETDPRIARHFPVLAHAMTHVAHLAIRNRGTIGGSLSHADPAAELPMMALLLDATLRLNRQDGEREIPAADFFLGSLTTALEPEEVLTAIRLPFLPSGAGWGFEETAPRAGDFATAAAACVLTRRGAAVTMVRLALMGVHETPLRVPAAEAVLLGQGPAAFAQAARIARDAVEPNSDLRASAELRRHMVEVQVGRVLAAAWARATEVAA
ncbi:xanthine dehydrogenase family protein subunit M [Roseomonas eburnea]|uniref:Xanthine dehydrogenase family protein subunit M n=1 Tax=Neoroseomonas eburnea TaxID=1346889 RepID=A0A9X9XB67_9PROT|nr:xanthine dehydrogenase family protein subunit M [Neoroseomonas eburnea]MBR0680953.1 xanthine dehydrogenase family protein subunit M [Neoroseomonas eburnea]